MAISSAWEVLKAKRESIKKPKLMIIDISIPFIKSPLLIKK